ncbi:sodium/hydrogen exchanger 9B2-like [Haplochromis burtoni]|uniref:sodium/hydrogen exchanger 9B2-like n=1 Tax=Haplochromis burtoni TaxID=8153 RepID=UPI001C2D0C57|nr:sodium/hydrogen exchanger 9B2-like [Haplochromis burtoni]
MLLAGLLLRNVPYITDAIFIDTHWSAALRNIALSIILTRAGLGLNPEALSRLKAVCVRVAVGPCMVEACIVCCGFSLPAGSAMGLGFHTGFCTGCRFSSSCCSFNAAPAERRIWSGEGNPHPPDGCWKL